MDTAERDGAEDDDRVAAWRDLLVEQVARYGLALGMHRIRGDRDVLWTWADECLDAAARLAPPRPRGATWLHGLAHMLHQAARWRDRDPDACLAAVGAVLIAQALSGERGGHEALGIPERSWIRYRATARHLWRDAPPPP